MSTTAKEFVPGEMWAQEEEEEEVGEEEEE